ncbi:glutamate synthase subunit beta [Eubacterium xylanophilum]|uniref:glutamate synthase subunit beta n=1 Tax=Eubacterium xylanophilum TaxID=39497 RepID=UPI00047ED89A|nr:glutamate synthase subunit beta [Eubacterium xylanophilum]
MGKATGFLEYDRQDAPVREPKDRINDFNEFHGCLSREQQSCQGARCMECGVPFCQGGSVIAGMVSGCPLRNLVPETNDLVTLGNYELAYKRLSSTHPFPEFTSRVCPALCEAACTCGLHGEPVSTKENEKTIIEYAFEKNLVDSGEPTNRTGKTVAVVGSGPAGLTVAKELNKRGHKVTVFERHDRVGGLLRYGIPNMKLDKRVIDRRIGLMEKAGIEFKTGVDIGKDIKGEELLEKFDRVVLCGGATNPRDIKVPGRESKGIYFAVDFLSKVTKRILDNDYKTFPYEMAKDKNVVVIGGGDTGNDCVGTAIRLGAKSVTQIEMMPKPPVSRAESNPWPEWPRIFKTDYGQEEAIYKFGEDPRIFEKTVSKFISDDKGNVSKVEIIDVKMVRDNKTGRMNMETVKGTEKEIDADLVLIAAGFLGNEIYTADSFGVECNERTNIKTQSDSYQTNNPKVFTAGDMHRGQSLVVWAMAEGKAAAKQVDKSLMGYTNL